MITLTLKCQQCKIKVTYSGLKMTEKGTVPRLKEIMKQVNFVQNVDGFLCEKCAKSA